MEEQRKMLTDMNDRERQRFIGQLDMLRKQVDAMIVALESDDDQALVAPSLLFMMAFSGVTDLFNVLAAAQWVDVGDLDRPMPSEDPDA